MQLNAGGDDGTEVTEFRGFVDPGILPPGPESPMGEGEVETQTGLIVRLNRDDGDLCMFMCSSVPDAMQSDLW